MRRLWIVLVIAWAIGLPGELPMAGSARSVAGAQSPVLDQYGGLTRLPCSNKTGHFILTKLDNRWWFCTPSGHGFISMSVGGVGPASKGALDCKNQSAYDFLVRKYGEDAFTWARQTLRRMTSWGFNSVGQDSVGQVQPWYTCRGCPWPGGTQPIKLPYIVEDRPALYASINRDGYAAGALKDVMTGVNSHYSHYRAMLPDVFDPNLGQWWRGELAAHRPQNVTANSPWILGVFTDDSDDFLGSGASPDFSTFPSGYNTANIGYLTVMASPTQTYQPVVRYGKHVLYTDTKVYSKADARNPTSACSITNPCSLRDYLWQKYRGNVTALNLAWGSNYTTFDSTGKEMKEEAIGTADGSTKVFTHTLAHHPVSPNSLLIFVGGTAKAGDCAWFHPNCNASSNAGSIASPDPSQVEQPSSRLNYSTGEVTVTFVTPPARGATVTADYIHGGWMAAGTGLMDESGDNSWVGQNHVCLEKSSSPYTVCVPGKEGVPNASPKAGADLDGWISQISAEYFKTMQAGLARYSSLPYLGLDQIGSWVAPAPKFFLQGAGPYINAAFVQLYADKPSAAEASAMYSYVTQYLGDVPLIDFITLEAQADSSESCRPAPNTFRTQQDRGQEYLSTVRTFLTTPGYNKDYPWVGFGWWAWQDFQNRNQGLVSMDDNAYDGKEAMMAPGKDPWGYQTGGESANYGDCLSSVKQANALWYTLKP